MAHAVYIHIPFCERICSYCDFCKILYQSKWVDTYLNALEQEIKDNYKGEEISTIYIGGGTPSILSTKELTKLFDILSILKKTEEFEYTVECNIENMTKEKLMCCKKNQVNRISYGVQTSHERFLTFLNRRHTKEQVRIVINDTKEVGIDNINVDFIYALPDETITEVVEDLTFFLSLEIPHISTYSLMIEPNTLLYIKKQVSTSEELDVDMYEKIESVLKEHHFNHYEISNYALDGFESKHNLVYWNNLEYYGFGMGASGYLDHVRYTNTRSRVSYIKSKKKIEEQTLSITEEMENEMILGLRKIEGVSKHTFLSRYQKEMEEVFPIKKLLEEGKLLEQDGYIRVHPNELYKENDILIQFIGD